MSDKDPKKDAGGADPAPAGKSKKKLLIVVAAVVVLLGARGRRAAIFMLRSPAEAGEPAGGAAAAASAGAQKYDGPAGLVEMEPFLVNINDPEAERFAKVQLKLAIVPERRAAELAGDALVLAQMRDRVLTLLTSKTYEELATPLGKGAFAARSRRGSIRWSRTARSARCCSRTSSCSRPVGPRSRPLLPRGPGSAWPGNPRTANG